VKFNPVQTAFRADIKPGTELCLGNAGSATNTAAIKAFFMSLPSILKSYERLGLGVTNHNNIHHTSAVQGTWPFRGRPVLTRVKRQQCLILAYQAAILQPCPASPTH
jgi:hypothetical protein